MSGQRRRTAIHGCRGRCGALRYAPPERRIGIAALDFALALGARDVAMTRATRVEGTPTVPSRWLLRLDTVLRAAGLEGHLAGDAAPLDWQRLIDEPTGFVPVRDHPRLVHRLRRDRASSRLPRSKPGGGIHTRSMPSMC